MCSTSGIEATEVNDGDDELESGSESIADVHLGDAASSSKQEPTPVSNKDSE